MTLKVICRRLCGCCLPVQDGIHNGAYVIGYAADVVQQTVYELLFVRGLGHVNSHKPLH